MSNHHTLGAWRVMKCDPLFDGPHGPMIGRTIELRGEGFAKEHREMCGDAALDAALVEASPVLLGALRGLLALAEHRKTGLDQSATHDGLNNCDALAKARSAIYKATTPNGGR